MGKAENRKRAKRLKEAKRKRELEALVSAGLGPASKALQQRQIADGIETRINTGKIKYSELLKEFARPIINETEDISITKIKFIFSFHAWNAAILGHKSEEIYQSAKKEFAKLMPDSPEFEQLFDKMVKRKKELFAEYNNIIVDFEMKKIRGFDYELTVATTPIKNL